MKLASLATWVALAALGTWGAVNCLQGAATLWPGLHQDGALYSTVAINRANHLGNLFDVYTFNLLMTQNAKEFNWHGQLYYPLAALLMAGPTYADFLRFVHSANFVTYVLAFVVFLMASHRILRCSWLLASAFGIAGAWSTTALLYYVQGRPEHGIPIALLIFYLFGEIRGSRFPVWMYGIVAGLVAAISPLPGFLFVVFAAFGCASRAESNASLIKNFLGLASATFLTWITVTFAFYPHSAIELVANSLNVQRHIYSFMSEMHLPFPFFNIYWFKSAWFTNPYVPAIGVIYIYAMLLLLGYVLRTLVSARTVFSKCVLLACLIVPLSQIWFSGFARPQINYSFLVFFPSVALWCMEQTESLSNLRKMTMQVSSKSGREARVSLPIVAARGILPFVLLAVIAFPGAGFAKVALLQRAVLTNGISYNEALERFNRLKTGLNDDEFILIDLYTNARSAVIFDGPPWKTRAYEIYDGPLGGIEDELGFKGKYIFYLQERGQTPPVRKGFEVIEKRFNSAPVRVFGYTIKHTTPGYGYAIYERKEQPIENEKPQ